MSELPFLELVASSDGYQLGFGDNVVFARLDGPATLHRQGYTGSAKLASVVWTLSPYQYAYFKAFWRARTKRGVMPFELEVIVRGALPIRQAALFVPGTVRLVGVEGLRYTVEAQVELTQLANIIDLSEVFASLGHLVNVVMPESMVA